MSFIRLRDQDPEESLDHTVDLTDWLSTGNVLDNNPVITAAQEGVSVPGELTNIVVDKIELDVPNKSVVVWLSGLTDQEVYTIKLIGTDDNTQTRQYVRRLKIKGQIK